VRQWRFDVAMVDGLVDLQGAPPEDGRTPDQMRADLMDYVLLPKLELQDVDGVAYDAVITSYVEQAVEPYDAAHPNGGWLVHIELAEVEE
jgi:hypothetical protein